MDSSWYFLRYTDALNDELCFEKSLADQWMMVDFYCGGIEHAQMHLIYARFMTKALRDLGLTSIDEPFNELLCQGMVNKSAPYCASCNITHTVDRAGSLCPHCDQPLTERSAKMSKSTGNTVSPEAMIELYGADTVRLFILFAANPTAGMDWSDTALEANHRVMLQLQAMPEQLSEWKGEASSMDAWLVTRFKSRVLEFIEAMDTYDLRRAVELSHYEVIKDINWYVRRGGEHSDVAAQILPQWAQMISVSTPHLAEEWWAGLQQSESFAASSHLQPPAPVTDDEHLILAGEQYIRDFLEQARKVQNIAERHLGGPAKSATVVLSPSWKREIARSALEAASAFIASDLGLESIVVVEGESEHDNTERAGSAMPLSPAIVYA